MTGVSADDSLQPCKYHSTNILYKFLAEPVSSYQLTASINIKLQVTGLDVFALRPLCLVKYGPNAFVTILRNRPKRI
jgi:hypothetical protein